MPDGPFGITQVDIPGIYGAVQSARMNRIQQMLGQQQVQLGQIGLQQRVAMISALPHLFDPTGQTPAPGTTSPARPAPAASSGPPSPTNPVAAVYAPPTGQSPVSPSAPPPPVSAAGAAPPAAAPGTPGATAEAPAGAYLQMNPQVAQRLAMSGPEGYAMVHNLMQLNAERLEAVQHHLQAGAPYFAQVAQIPLGTGPDPLAPRRAAIQSMVPQLRQLGYTDQEITGFEPTDQNLNSHFATGQQVNDIITNSMPHPVDVQLNSDLVDPRHIDPATGRPRVLYESQFVGTPTEPRLRPQSMRQLPPNAQELRAQADEAIRLGAPRAQVEARLAQQLQALSQGGAPPPDAAGTFPRQDNGAFDFRAHP